MSIGAVHNWVKAYREGGMAALQAGQEQERQPGQQARAAAKPERRSRLR